MKRFFRSEQGFTMLEVSLYLLAAGIMVPPMIMIARATTATRVNSDLVNELHLLRASLKMNVDCDKTFAPINIATDCASGSTTPVTLVDRLGNPIMKGDGGWSFSATCSALSRSLVVDVYRPNVAGSGFAKDPLTARAYDLSPSPWNPLFGNVPKLCAQKFVPPPSAVAPGLSLNLNARLSLSGNAPTCEEDSSCNGKGNTVFLFPYQGNNVPTYDSGTWTPHNLTAPVSLNIPTSPVNQNYDIFVYFNSAANSLALESLQWANNGVTRVQALNSMMGTNVNPVDNAVYLGTVRTDGAGKVNDNQSKRFVSNAFNRLSRPLYLNYIPSPLPTLATFQQNIIKLLIPAPNNPPAWGVPPNAWEIANNDPKASVEAVKGLPDAIVKLNLQENILSWDGRDPSTGGGCPNQAYIAIAADSSTPSGASQTTDYIGSNSANTRAFGSLLATYTDGGNITPMVGHHVYYGLEYTNCYTIQNSTGAVYPATYIDASPGAWVLSGGVQG